jgi:hypothetical protein
MRTVREHTEKKMNARDTLQQIIVNIRKAGRCP